MQPQVLPPRLRAVYRVPFELARDLVGGVAFGAVALAMAVSIAVIFDAAMTTRPLLQAPVLTPPPSVEEPEMHLGYHGYNDGVTEFRDLTWQPNDHTLVFDTVLTATDNTLTVYGTIEAHRSDDDMSCTITIDPLNGILQECEDHVQKVTRAQRLQ